jgi:hypothetical protein
MKMEQTECSETSAYKIQTRGYYPEESIQNSQPGESLKSKLEASPCAFFLFPSLLGLYCPQHPVFIRLQNLIFLQLEE